jgi:S1-C subfamily serine protease
MRRTLGIVVAAAAVGAVAGATAGLVVGQGRTGSNAVLPQAPVLARRAPASAVRTGAALSPETIYRTDSPAVVVIRDTVTQIVPPTFFTPGGKEQVGALGSGFVVDRNGDIVTNDHVVQGAHNIRVGFSGGATYPAKIVGIDPTTDIAVVRVTAPVSALHPLVFANSGSVQVGDRVYAIGNPFGLERTMTAGIVSATGRDIQAPNGHTIPGAIQTDAPINHGNSGGPLLDRYGRVVGVNAQLEGGTVDANVGVGFAVPSSTARTVASQLIAHGRAAHPWLGVEIETIDPSVARVVRGLPEHGVVVLRVVKGSPAANAGLQPASRQVTVGGVTAFTGGDSIVAVNGKPIASSGQLFDVLAPLGPGDHVALRVVRGSAARTVDVTLGNVPG